MSYDGFISYSHAADDLLAPRLQAGLQRFAKPWWQRRALRIFRDESSLSANPHLWSDGSLWARVTLDTPALVDRAREAVADRPLTAQECRTYRIDPCPTPEERSGEG